MWPFVYYTDIVGPIEVCGEIVIPNMVHGKVGKLLSNIVCSEVSPVLW